MSNATLVLTVCFALALGSLPSDAHHSFAAEFDAEKPFKMSGTVTKVEWQNPHSWFYIDVRDDTGNVTNWGMELASPNLLMRSGWTRTTLKIGDDVVVEGFHARDGRNVGNARVIVLTATGRSLLGGSSQSGSAR
jgi:hypothetical protein